MPDTVPMIARSRSPGLSTPATAPFFITIRRSVMSARKGSCVTNITAFLYFRRQEMTRSLLMPAFSISSRSRIGVWPIRIASAIRSDRVWPPESPVIRMDSAIFSPVNLFASAMVRAIRL